MSLVGVGCSSAGVLAFEIVLTRVFSVTQFYHFAFLTVSLGLLGFGASGSALAAFPRLGRGGPRRWAVLGFAQGVSTLGAYAVTNRIPFDRIEPYVAQRLVDDHGVWGTTLFDEVQALGYDRSYPTFTRRRTGFHSLTDISAYDISMVDRTVATVVYERKTAP